MKYSTEQLYAPYTVCANHFEDRQFMNPAKKEQTYPQCCPHYYCTAQCTTKADTKKATT